MTKKITHLFKSVIALSLMAAGFTLASSAQSNEEAHAWLKKMALNAGTINYKGIVSYQYGDVLVSAKMSQRIINGKKNIRLSYLDGQQEEFLSEADKVMFVGSKPQSGQNEKKLVDSNIKSLPERLSKLGDNYQLRIIAEQKIAGRNAVVLSMTPTDPFRYAHNLSIDKETGLLLKTETIGDSSIPLERFQFMQVSLNPAVMKDNFKMSITKAKAKKSFISTMKLASQGSSQHELKWKLGWMPKGYSAVSASRESSDRTSALFTDGMCSFSVYVEPKASDFKGGVMKQGASIVLSQQVALDGKQKVVTVAGDIPLATAERIIQSISER